MAASGRAGRWDGDVPGSRLAPGWGDFTYAVEHFPALCAGRLVRAGGHTTLAWQGLPHPVCGRLRHRLHRCGGRPAGAGGLAAATEQVRLDDPSRQNQARAVLATVATGDREWSGRGSSTGDVHLTGVHPLLGAFLEGDLGGEAQDGFESSESGAAEHRPLVSAQPAPAARRTTANAGSEVTRSFRVLRYHRQQPCVVDVPDCGRALLAVLAESPESRAFARLGLLQSPAGAVSASADESGPLGVRSRSESLIGGTVCANVRTYGSVGALGG